MSGELEAVGFRTEAGFDGLDVKGTLWGGNLCVLNSLLGTPHWPRVKGGMLFLEDVNEHPYRIERMLLQLHQAGVLDAQKAVCWAPSRVEASRRWTAAIRWQGASPHLRTVTATPILTGLPFGHVPTKVTLPVGAAGGRCWCRAGTCSSAGSIRRLACKPAWPPELRMRTRAPAHVARRHCSLVLAACNNNPLPDGAAATNTLFYSFDRALAALPRPDGFVLANRNALHLPDLRAALRLPLPEAPLRAGAQGGGRGGQAALPGQGRAAPPRRRRRPSRWPRACTTSRSSRASCTSRTRRSRRTTRATTSITT